MAAKVKIVYFQIILNVLSAQCEIYFSMKLKVEYKLKCQFVETQFTLNGLYPF